MPKRLDIIFENSVKYVVNYQNYSVFFFIPCIVVTGFHPSLLPYLEHLLQ